MIWLTWRQHRLEVVGAVIGLTLVGAFLIATGLPTRAAFDSRVQPCLGLSGTAYLQHGCQGILRDFKSEATFNDLIGYLNLLPALVGLFIGAPLVSREIERGTHRLVWTQGISRLRWFTIKLVLLAAVSALLAVAFTAAMTWWRSPVDQVQGRFLPLGFDFEGLMPAVYALFAFSLGVAVGTVMQRTVAAMAVTLLGFLAVRFPVEHLLRPHYMAALTTTAAMDSGNPGDPGLTGSRDWIVDGGLMDHAGHRLNNGQLSQLYSDAAAAGGNLKGGVDAYIQAHGYHGYTDFQPAGRFWAFQASRRRFFSAWQERWCSSPSGGCVDGARASWTRG